MEWLGVRGDGRGYWMGGGGGKGGKEGGRRTKGKVWGARSMEGIGKGKKE